MAFPNMEPVLGEATRLTSLVERLKPRLLDVPQQGQNVSIQTYRGGFVAGSANGAPYLLQLAASLSVATARNGDTVTWEALAAWTHADGSGQGYASQWTGFQLPAGDGGAVGTFMVQTAAQFSDPPGTQFLGQIIVRNVKVNGQSLPDAVNGQQVPVSIPASGTPPAQTGWQGSGGYNQAPPTYSPGTGYNQGPSQPQPPPSYSPPAGSGSQSGGGGSWYPGFVIVSIIQSLFGGGQGGGSGSGG